MPKFYLKRFVDQRTRKLHSYDKRLSRWGSVSPKSATVEDDFYSVNLGDGLSDVVEKKFARIESDVAPLLRAIGPNSSFDQQTKVDLSGFLALMIVRTKPWRDCARELSKMASTVEASLQYIDSVEPKLVRKFGQEEVDHLRQEIKLSGTGIQIGKNDDLLFLRDRLTKFGQLISLMEWRLETSASERFVTSDSPVTIRNTHQPFDPNAVGLTRDDLNVELVFPLCPYECLVCSWTNQFGWHRSVPKTRVREINRRITVCAHTYVYASDTSLEMRAVVHEYGSRFVHPIDTTRG